MICELCKLDLPARDFVNNQSKCYKCFYREKAKKSKKRGSYTCRECRKQFSLFVTKGMKQRRVFCSEECAFIGHKKQITAHWTKVLSKNSIIIY